MAMTDKRNRIKLALVAGVTVFAIVLSIGSAYARLIDWASTAFIYTPSDQATPNSDCLVPEGQQILLADWQPEESERVVTIGIERPSVVEPETTVPEETTLPVETEPEPTPTDPSEPVETEPTDIWPDTEVKITLDKVADAQLTCTVQVNESDIQLRLERREDAEALQEAVSAVIHVEWCGLKGSFVIRLLPAATTVSGEETEPDRQVVTGLEHVLVNDTINPDKPIACVKLNLKTLSDFTLRFLSDEASLYKVRWSTDGGKTYSLLYDSNILKINYPYTAGWDGTVFLDFSLCLLPEQRPTIAVTATGYQLEEYTPVLQALPEADQLVLKTSLMPHTILLNPVWGAAKLRLQPIQHLIADETGNLIYQDDTSLIAEVTGQGIQITSSDPALLPASGSYRMRIQWIWNETVVEEEILYFFVNTN